MSHLENKLDVASWEASKKALDELSAGCVELIHQTVDLLGSERPAVRVNAAWLLRRIGEELSATSERLAKLVFDPETAGREAVVAALRYVGDRKAEPVLIRALQDSSPDVRMGSAFALGRIGGPAAIPALVAAAADEDYEVMDNAIRALIEIGPPALQYLTASLEDKDPSVRRQARDILADFADPLTGPALVRAMSDPSAEVRAAAALAGGAIGGQDLVPPLAELLGQDENREVRREAARALGRISGDDAARALQIAADQDPDTEVRAVAETALTTSG